LSAAGEIPGAPRAAHHAVLGLVLVALAAGVVTMARRPPPASFLPTGRTGTGGATIAVAAAPATDGAHALRSEFVSTRLFVHTHAACLVEVPGGKVRAFWYAGTDEGTQDVTIQTAVFDPATARWSPEKTVASRETTQRALWRYVKKVGNPVAARAADGALWLFYVTVSLGGWGGSSITAVTSRDDGETWDPARRLITSPFFNLSTLVKSPAFRFADGTLGLPVHHEFIGKFGEVLRLDGAGALLDKVRLSAGRAGLQPVVLVEDARRAVALMRYAGSGRPRRVMRTTTDDAGRLWTPVARTPLANSNAALTGLVLPDGRLLIALNDSEDMRDVLTLAVSSDGGMNWRTIFRVEDQAAAESPGMGEARYSAAIAQLARASDAAVTDPAGMAQSVKRQMFSRHGYSFEFSYPSLLRTSRGDFHLVYTWNEAFIKHVQFDQAWLDEKLK
jgi:predicted neuraminidase